MKRQRPPGLGTLASAIRALCAEKRLVRSKCSPELSQAHHALIEALLTEVKLSSPDDASVISALAVLRNLDESDVIDVDSDKSDSCLLMPYTRVRSTVLESLAASSGTANLIARIIDSDRDSRVGEGNSTSVVVAPTVSEGISNESRPSDFDSTRTGPKYLLQSSQISQSTSEHQTSIPPLFRLNRTPGAPVKYSYTMPEVVVNLRARLVVIMNFLIDVSYLKVCAPTLFTADKIVLIHGMDNSELLGIIEAVFDDHERQRIRLIRPVTPPYGTVHSKAVISFFGSAGCRVFIHTANDEDMDWEMRTEAAWLRDFPPKQKSGNRPSEFESKLVEYFRHIQSRGPERSEVIEDIAREIAKYDFSSAGCALVTSVPGKHAPSVRSRFGHLRIRSLLCNEDIDESSEDASVVIQFSSLGSIREQWLEEFGTSLFASRCRLSQESNNVSQGLNMKDSDRLELVLPTMEQMSKGVESWAAGRALPITGRNVHRDHIDSRLHSWTCTDSSGRSRAMPHMKSLLRYHRRCPSRIAWVYIGSANLSGAAWGTVRNGTGNLDILSYEMGVMMTPKAYVAPIFSLGESVGVNYFGCSTRSETIFLHSFADGSNFTQEIDKPQTTRGSEYVPVPIPYCIPPVRYENDDVPWHVDPGGPACKSPVGITRQCLTSTTVIVHAQNRGRRRENFE